MLCAKAGLPVLTLLVLTACGASSPTSSTAQSPATTATPVLPAPSVSAAPSPALPSVPDFAVVAYQGDETFGGHEGHFRAAFAAGRPVVLLYFAGL